MGGRGFMIFFILIACPAFFERMSISKIIALLAFLLIALGLIYSLRTIDPSDNSIWSSTAQYIGSAWYGFSLATSGYPETNHLSWFLLGSSDVLEFFPYPIFSGFGNLFGGMGQLIHSYGLVGGPLVLLANTLIFIGLTYKSPKGSVVNMYVQHLSFLYFIFFLFHDLSIFLPSYLIALTHIFLLKLMKKQDTKTILSD